ncbi:unnamed protein product [Bursaphelenchus xylophilus]|uniref:(pine wood nematode) hypothetical protein n=1 Tax=Bursaphelenchus xylophilus TaxID=6326 RepID=A0A1I7RKU3_BURXY|nr:unnamed protein product [Bursaphelenchus xylophilus]CAG9131100.1 unnamed protein product [Bursaphelenchus xylophilus]
MSERNKDDDFSELTESTSGAYNPPRAPDFSNEEWRMSRDQWQDLIMRSITENREVIDEEFNGFNLFLSPKAVEFIFTLCVRLQLPHEVRYLAVHLYDRYMSSQVVAIHNEIFTSDDDDQLKAERWGNALNRYYSQTVLRIVSCVSIAVKSLYYKLTLTTKMQYRILRSMNFLYDERAILKSETRVFSLVMFDIDMNRSPIFMIESHICFLLDQFREVVSSVDPEAIWEYSILYTDFIYLNMKSFYCRLFRKIHGESAIINTIEPARIWHLEADFVILSISVVLMSFFALYGDEMTQKVAVLFKTHIGIDLQEMSEFVTVARDMIMEYEPETPTIFLPEELLGLKKVTASYSPGFF